MTSTVALDRRSGRSGGRRRRGWIITIVVVLIVLVGLDFTGRAVAQNVLADKIEQQEGLTSKPDVAIDGFPFLTQAAAKKFARVGIKISNLTEGPVTINAINATATDVRVSSYAFSRGTIGNVSGTALISFGSLGNTLENQIGPLGALLNGAGLRLSEAGPDEVEATMNLLVTTGSATWRVTQLSGNRLNVHLVSSSGLPSSVLGSIQDVTLQIPKLPLGLTISNISVTQSGVVGQVHGHDLPFSG